MCTGCDIYITLEWKHGDNIKGYGGCTSVMMP